jgi:hypothetical protein
VSKLDRSRKIVFTRDHDECVVVGSIWQTLQPCGGPLTVQHRVGRGMGGSKKYDAPEYLVAMCLLHNGLAESSATFAAYCTRNGLSRIPVRYHDSWYLLSGDMRFRIPDATAVDMMVELYGDDYHE